jgi:hypothetical protein
MTTKHTPGPWQAHDDGTITTADEAQCVVASVNTEHVTPGQAAHDAFLIAAAPAMLALISSLVGYLGDQQELCEGEQSLMDEACALIWATRGMRQP